eukprot:TRINITY_DN6132_c0_g1_i1.p1 TRINITY_DN6132_c0_g1~~TRINITY_DN6132_c0_g1_i1.p1  ORF type:complete len:442 (+),score=74.26 TRINITY_DN6132_c0_g1_i1:68-1393(+)
MVTPEVKLRERTKIIDKYDLIYKVGEGTYGLVYKASIKGKDREKVAIKQIKTTKEGEGISLTACREVMLLKEIKHKNIIKLHEVILHPDDRSLYLVFEYAELDLFEIIKHHRENLKVPISESTVKSLIWQVLNGINYLHCHWIVHRDLKPSNILVMGEGGGEPGVVKIADFGLARLFQSPLRPLSENGVVVTIWYRAPELLLGSKHYTRAVDIWAIGCIFAELLLVKPIFPGRENPSSSFQEDQLQRIFSVLGKPSPEVWPSVVYLPEWKKISSNPPAPTPSNPSSATSSGWSNSHPISNLRKYFSGLSLQYSQTYQKEAFDLLSKMIEYDPSKRISAADALEHPFFKDLNTLNSFASSNPISYPIRRQLEEKKDLPTASMPIVSGISGHTTGGTNQVGNNPMAGMTGNPAAMGSGVHGLAGQNASLQQMVNNTKRRKVNK